MTIDATRAAQALGIKHPVRFEHGELGTATAAVNPTDPSLIKVNTRTLYQDAAEAGWTPAQIIAHELVHVRQMQDIGDPAEAHRLYSYENATRGYGRNRFEMEADRLAPIVAPLVEVRA